MYYLCHLFTLYFCNTYSIKTFRFKLKSFTLVFLFNQNKCL